VTTLEAKTTPRATDLLARLDKVVAASMSSLKRPKPFN
jgi:hypothetical protein